MNFLIEHQYVILYFSGAFFSLFAMLSYVKVGNSLVSGPKKLNSPDEFFEGFDNQDLEALLDESFDVDENIDFTPATSEVKESSRKFAFVEAAKNNSMEQGGE